jgi:hypothetical protein
LPALSYFPCKFHIYSLVCLFDSLDHNSLLLFPEAPLLIHDVMELGYFIS